MKNTPVVIATLGLMLTAGLAVAQQSTVTPLPPVAPRPLVATTPAMTEIMSAIPAGSLTITTWYKQNVYDMANAKVGDISDVLVSPVDGKITAVVIGVGGFLGMDQKNVGVSFNSIKQGVMDGKAYLTINTTKDALSAARGLKYDSNSSMWIMADLTAK